ncbi:MAG: hypothetical protein MUE46_00630 [Xanthomonadales bacterium]|jgi:hypothetical protein|nr:hypothetical protein [Xanthomonadales bacterium]
MIAVQVERLSFHFPTDWQVGKYDDWAFYRNQFVRQFNGLQGVDLIAHAADGTAFLIEVKDYRHPDTEKPSALPQAIANKVLMTLAALLPAKLHATAADEQALAAAVLTCKRLHVIAHVELPRAHRAPIDPADLRLKLKQLLRAVDPHPTVVSTTNMRGLAWTVS